MELKKQDQYADFTMRLFLAEKGKEKIPVRHYHFTAWPDKRVPDFPTSLLEFRNFIRRKEGEGTKDRKPIVVHCR